MLSSARVLLVVRPSILLEAGPGNLSTRVKTLQGITYLAQFLLNPECVQDLPCTSTLDRYLKKTGWIKLNVCGRHRNAFTTVAGKVRGRDDFRRRS